MIHRRCRILGLSFLALLASCGDESSSFSPDYGKLGAAVAGGGIDLNQLELRIVEGPGPDRVYLKELRCPAGQSASLGGFRPPGLGSLREIQSQEWNPWDNVPKWIVEFELKNWAQTPVVVWAWGYCLKRME